MKIKIKNRDAIKESFSKGGRPVKSHCDYYIESDKKDTKYLKFRERLKKRYFPLSLLINIVLLPVVLLYLFALLIVSITEFIYDLIQKNDFIYDSFRSPWLLGIIRGDGFDKKDLMREPVDENYYHKYLSQEQINEISKKLKE